MTVWGSSQPDGDFALHHVHGCVLWNFALAAWPLLFLSGYSCWHFAIWSAFPALFAALVEQVLYSFFEMADFGALPHDGGTCRGSQTPWP